MVGQAGPSVHYGRNQGLGVQGRVVGHGEGLHQDREPGVGSEVLRASWGVPGVESQEWRARCGEPDLESQVWRARCEEPGVKSQLGRARCGEPGVEHQGGPLTRIRAEPIPGVMISPPVAWAPVMYLMAVMDRFSLPLTWGLVRYEVRWARLDER